MPIYTDYIAETIWYNLQILPDSLMTGILLLAIILANQSLLALAAGAVGTQLLTSAVGRIFMQVMPGAAKRTNSNDMCNGGFISKAFNAGDISMLWHPSAPSTYLAIVGFFVGYGAALQQLYREEIDAKVMSRSTMIMASVISFLILMTVFIFRVYSGCESIIGAAGGTLFGLALGFFGCIALGYATDRRATNVWGIPLLRDRINSGSAVYVCSA